MTKKHRNKPLFKFLFYVSRGNSGFTLILFAEEETKALAKAKRTVVGDNFRIQAVEEISSTTSREAAGLLIGGDAN